VPCGGSAAGISTSKGAANLSLFLTCDNGAFITGSNIDINGGMVVP